MNFFLNARQKAETETKPPFFSDRTYCDLHGIIKALVFLYKAGITSTSNLNSTVNVLAMSYYKSMTMKGAHLIGVNGKRSKSLRGGCLSPNAAQLGTVCQWPGTAQLDRLHHASPKGQH